MQRRVLSIPLATAMFCLALATAAVGQDKAKDNAPSSDKAITQADFIKGTMEIDFKTRTELDNTGKLKEGSPAKGARDVYKFNIAVATTTEYVGNIYRQPQLLSSIVLREVQPAQLEFKVDLAVRNPKNPSQRKVVGDWVGTIPIDPKTGVYDLAGGAKLPEPSPFRIAITSTGGISAFTDKFGGKLVGKSKQEQSLTAYTYKRLIGDKTVELKVTKVDPMKFVNLELAKGPSTNYPHAVVNGRLDYDYETGNWLTDGIRIRYNYDGKDVEDIITGSIKWVEDENRKTNGKGYYDFNLRFNEEKYKDTTTEADAFEKLSEEEAFFEVDDSIPCLTGTISYEDKFIAGGDSDEPIPASSKVTYAINANRITKEQAVNFFKLWMVCVGPTNDE